MNREEDGTLRGRTNAAALLRSPSTANVTFPGALGGDPFATAAITGANGRGRRLESLTIGSGLRATAEGGCAGRSIKFLSSLRATSAKTRRVHHS